MLADKTKIEQLNRIGKLIQDAHDIVLTTHINPDGDALGSMLALFHALTNAGYKVRMIHNDDIPEKFSFLPGCKSIEKAVTSVECDLLIVLDMDISDTDRLGSRGTHITYNNSFCIDHHKSNSLANDYCIVDKTAAATGEFLYIIIEYFAWEYTTAIDLCLYVAISTDCGNFRYANTTPRTMRIAAALLEKGVRPDIVDGFISAKSFTEVKVIGEVIDGLKLWHDQIAYAVLDNDLYTRSGGDSDSFIDIVRSIDGCEITALFKEHERQVFKISLRSKHVDVADFAQNYGGGGHAKAAGFTVRGSKEVVVSAVMSELYDFVSRTK